MSKKTNILWTEATWNVITGCSKVSPGCKFCYALRDWDRLAKTEGSVYFNRKFNDLMYHPERLAQPLRWTKPRLIFVNSMSDLFHEDLNNDIIDSVFALMALCEALMEKSHIFQILTKRASRMHTYLNDPATFGRIILKMGELASEYVPKKVKNGIPVPSWPLNNVWLGVSVENQELAEERVPLLLDTPAVIRWVSAEPLLGPLVLSNIKTGTLSYIDALKGVAHVMRGMKPINKIDWVVVGGESGPVPTVRPMEYLWPLGVKNECIANGTAFLFKQWGAYYPETQTVNTKMIPYAEPSDDIPMLDGKTWVAYPTVNNV